MSSSRVAAILLLAVAAWAPRGAAQLPGSQGGPTTDWKVACNHLVDDAVAGAGVKDPRVLDAMRKTPRHEFVPLAQRRNSYYDMALPIGSGQTISPPFVVAYMTEQLEPQPTDKVLEIGTGSGYQAAILSPLVAEVYTIEIVPELGKRAAATLKRLGYQNVFAKVGDGYQGWPEHAPFDKIIVTCSPENVPRPLVEQLKEGGRMIIPLGERYQQSLYVLTKREGELVSEALLPTLFVPMTGAAEAQREKLPDPANPAIRNGGFEETIEDSSQPRGWHYQRHLTRVDDPAAPEGRHYVQFTNDVPGRVGQALQGMSLDGREVQAIEISARVKLADVRPGASRAELPAFTLIFYDERRGTLGDTSLGPWSGTADWFSVRQRVEVPVKAREMILRIGLLGATGTLSIDDLQLKVVERRGAAASRSKGP